MCGFVDHLITEKTKSGKIEKIVSSLKDLKYGDLTIINVLDALGDSTNPTNKELKSALTKAKVKSKDLAFVMIAIKEEA